MTGSPDEPNMKQPSGVLRVGWLLLGLAFVGLGLIGALLPLMPTTVFLILAAGCFARSSPKLERWLLDHPRLGPSLRAWRAERAIPRSAKIAACVGMAGGFLIFVLTAHPHLLPALCVAAVLGLCAAWILTRPAPRGGR